MFLLSVLLNFRSFSVVQLLKNRDNRQSAFLEYAAIRKYGFSDSCGSAIVSQVALRSMAAVHPRAAIRKTPNRRLRLLLKYQYATRIMLFIAVSYANYSV